MNSSPVSITLDVAAPGQDMSIAAPISVGPAGVRIVKTAVVGPPISDTQSQNKYTGGYAPCGS